MLPAARCCSEIFDVWKKEAQQDATGTYGPVLIIDEANALMSWADTHPEELRDLLQYFVRITKQEQQCHVVMATAEFGYQTWLYKGGCTVKAARLPAAACRPFYSP